jgi:hypothetical protein
MYAVQSMTTCENDINEATEKVLCGVSGDKVLAELLPYNVFLNDQMESERESYGQVISMLRV